MEAGDGTHATKDYYIERTKSHTGKYLKVGCLMFAISLCLMSAIKNANLRTDALLNVTRIASHEAVNTTLDEDLSNCTTTSLKDCTLISNGTWYIEAKNSFYGRLLNYSYFMDNGDIVSCKELRDGDVSEENGLPCVYYVGLSVCIGCLLSATLIVILEWTEPQKVAESIVNCLTLSFILFLGSHLSPSTTVRDFSGNIVGSEDLYSTVPSLLHFYFLALVGWISVYSQRHFLVMKKSRIAVSTWGHVWDVIVRWAPYCTYFPAFFFINWQLSHVIPLFPYGMMPACDESCWLRQKTLLFSFAPPVAVFALFNINGVLMLKYNGQYLEHPHVRKNFVIFSKLFYFLLVVWFFGVLVNCVESLNMFRVLYMIFVVLEAPLYFKVVIELLEL